MKKFEEELKIIPVMGREPIRNQALYSKCDIVELSNGWVSPEDHQAEIAKLNSKIDWLHGLLDERNEEVLQTVKLLNEATPEIPEVPKFVADWLDKKPLYTINSFIPVEIIGWSKKQTGYADLGMNINHLLKLKVNGYTVETPKAIVTPCPVCGYEDVESNFCGICGHKNEYMEVAKEKRFYLKNKLTGLNLVVEKTFSLTGKHVGERFREFEMQYIPTDEQEARLYKNTFTQKEIDSLAADSYEKIEVEE